MGEVAVAVAGVFADILSEPDWGNEGVGGLDGRKLHFDETETFVTSVEDVKLGSIVTDGDAVAGLLHHVAVALGFQAGVGVGRHGELLLAVDDGGGGGTHLLLDGENKKIAHPADAQGGRCA